MIIDKSSHKWILDNLYLKSYLDVYEQYPIGIRFHLGIIDNHDEMKEAYESDNEIYKDDLVGIEIPTKKLRELRKTGAYCYENNECFDLQKCTPYPMKSLKNDHWHYLRTNTWWGKRGLTVFGPKVHTYIPEENCTYVLFWNCVFQEFVMKHRIKTARPTTTINSDDTVMNIEIEHEGLKRKIFVVTSTEDKHRNHTESLKDAKIFVEPGEDNIKVLYK